MGVTSNGECQAGAAAAAAEEPCETPKSTARFRHRLADGSVPGHSTLERESPAPALEDLLDEHEHERGREAGNAGGQTGAVAALE